ncbi:ROK family protein [Palleronia sp.]|uniref:ROK family protein n=1 Tax=Palleronia sp. TaxID=1940284 RepID=UPI0035C7BF7E
MIGGIDLGGTKIEAQLFDPLGQPVGPALRVPAPRRSVADLVTALAGRITWLDAAAGRAEPVGLAHPGAVDPATRRLSAVNLVASGHALGPALTEVVGRDVPMLNDGLAVTLSEARGGAGTGRVVPGIVAGTGLGGGVAIDGRVPPRAGGRGLGIGHVGLPARALKRHRLPLRPCGCGAEGCAEMYCSGTAIAFLRKAVPGDPLSVRADLLALSAAILTLGPDAIVLCGGAPRIPRMDARLSRTLDRYALGGATPPPARRASFGDASGAQGAALHAGPAA